MNFLIEYDVFCIINYKKVCYMIPLSLYKEDERVQVVDKNNELKEGRVLRITPFKDHYAIITVLPDDKGELVVVQRPNKINKI